MRSHLLVSCIVQMITPTNNVIVLYPIDGWDKDEQVQVSTRTTVTLGWLSEHEIPIDHI